MEKRDRGVEGGKRESYGLKRGQEIKREFRVEKGQEIKKKFRG